LTKVHPTPIAVTGHWIGLWGTDRLASLFENSLVDPLAKSFRAAGSISGPQMMKQDNRRAIRSEARGL